ncbi:LysR family transcriptional regulator [uncultured Tateyamaria sp.]|uniref:LysR family transcriptional regulator n=1 Tax=uncultured Tateyamaria sp. TaxID=455651 RepID=UPI002615CB1A|nr:LysR family transcriptional regulator [uncultured Tateyamaria sp.]
MSQTDWSHIQSFAAVAEHGSLSAAARAVGTSQPTLSRHITALESDLGTRLFDRSLGGMTPTVAGTELMAHAMQMSDAAARFHTKSTHSDLSGTVRITASQVVAAYLLPDAISALRLTYPDIIIEVVASDSTDNLLRREADIALRMYRPTQNDVITRHLRDMPVAAYAARSYIARRGAPKDIADVLNHDVIGYDRSTLIIDGFRAAGHEVNRDFFAFRSDDQVVCWALVQAGAGIGFMQRSIGDADPNLICVSGAETLAIVPMWLTAHPDLRSTPRVRRVYDWLADHLKK